MAKNNFVKRNIKKDLNDVLDFCREKGINIGYSLDSNSKSNFESRYTMRRNLTDGDEVTYYLMDDDIELFSIVLDFYDITTNLMEELNAKIQTTFMPYIFKNL
jgi:hypothetical protein